MADDLDFDAVERLLDNAEGAAYAEPEKESRKRSRSRRRDRHRDDDKERRGDDKRDRDRDRDRERERGADDRDRDRERERERRREEPVERRQVEDPAERERRKQEEYLKKETERAERRRREEEEEKQRLAEEATRGDRTVFVTNVTSRAGEREVYEFFSKFAGKVRDVQIIRDQRSHKSKGVCYVEFYLQDSVMKALSLSGQVMDGNPIRVVPSQADKNRTAAVLAKAFQPPAQDLAGMKIYVGNLVDALANVTEDELRKLFSPFGNITFIDLHRDPYTNKCKGYAYIMFDKALEAKEALTAMNNFELAGQRLKVGLATDHLIPGQGAQMLTLGNAAPAAPEVDGGLTESLTDEGPGNHPGLLKDASARMALMQKLQQKLQPGIAPPVPPNGMMPPIPMPPVLPGAIPGPNGMGIRPMPMHPQMGQLNVCLKHMFDSSAVDLNKEPHFYREIEEDVFQECNSHGPVQKVVVDKVSADGSVFVRFSNPNSASACRAALDRRWFAGSQIQASFVDDNSFGQVANRPV